MGITIPLKSHYFLTKDFVLESFLGGGFLHIFGIFPPYLLGEDEPTHFDLTNIFQLGGLVQPPTRLRIPGQMPFVSPAMPMALAADGGWRALPLARATAVGVC